jgi:hypothetical protein
MTYCHVNWVHYKYASFHVGRLGKKKKFSNKRVQKYWHLSKALGGQTAKVSEGTLC